jgi:hypothetical protein
LYPFCVFAAVLVVADTHWPHSIDAFYAGGYQPGLGDQILDLVAQILEPMKFGL